jgi:3-dehydroquinate synthase
MPARTIRINGQPVQYFFGERLTYLKKVLSPKSTVLLTDANVFALHQQAFKGWKAIVIPAGEAHKVQRTVDSVVDQLLQLGADRSFTLVGVGGGVVTDLAGYVAAIYLRGIACGLVPTTLLAMVDAAIGGKNGIDVGSYKNMVGTIRQPRFLLFDTRLLATLPEGEWRNGFAEIIKHGAIRDAALFRQLERRDASYYQKRRAEVETLVQRNAMLKTKVVQGDEREQGDRKLLNFGHTLGHAIETRYELSHGEAIAIGMGFASRLSAEFLRFRHPARLTNLLEQYGLPVSMKVDADAVLPLMQKDKKRVQEQLDFIMLERIGKAVIHPVTFQQLYSYLV